MGFASEKPLAIILLKEASSDTSQITGCAVPSSVDNFVQRMTCVLVGSPLATP